MTKYKMMGDIEQGVHYTTFHEDVEDENGQDQKRQAGAAKSIDLEEKSVDRHIFDGKKGLT